MIKSLKEAEPKVGKIEKVKDIIIYKDENYNTFPNAVKKRDGSIIVGFRQAPDWQNTTGSESGMNFKGITHIDPSSKAVFVSSNDNGGTWDVKPSVIYDDFVYGVQDPCLNMLENGMIFCTFFMWKVFRKEDLPKILPTDNVFAGKWVGRRDKAYSIRSSNGGITWDEPIPVEYPGGKHIAVRGNTVSINSDTILLAVYGDNDVNELSKTVILKTDNFGKTWTKVSTITSKQDYNFYEPNLYRTNSGKLVAFIRSKKQYHKNNSIAQKEDSPLFTCESFDNGNTWSVPVKRDFYSPSPFHALMLESGNVLVTYGYRYEPYGLRAFLLDSECSNFEDSEDIILRDDGCGSDIGYTNSVLLNNGEVLITYYYYDKEDGLRYIAGTICKEV